MESETRPLHPFVARCGDIFADMAVPIARFREHALKAALATEDPFYADRDALVKWVEGQCYALWRDIFEHYVGQVSHGHLTKIAVFDFGSVYTRLLALEDAFLAYRLQAAYVRKDNPSAPSITKAFLVEGYKDLQYLEGKLLAENGWKREWLVEEVDMKTIASGSPALAEKIYEARRCAAQFLTGQACFQGSSLILHAE